MCSQLKMFYLLRIKLKTTKLVETIGWILISFKERQLPYGRRCSYHPRHREILGKIGKKGEPHYILTSEDIGQFRDKSPHFL